MKNLFQKYLILATDTTRVQFFRYLLVGGIATVVDALMFFVAVNVFEGHYLVAQTVGFLAGLALSYLLSILWIFQSSGNIQKEFFLFTIIGIGGLILSYVILYILIDVLNFYHFQFMLAKLIAVILVLFWNFGMRKKFVF